MPATDEFLLYDWSTWPAGRLINSDLIAQKGYAYNTGFDIAFTDKVSVKTAGFWLDTRNEIYYDPYLYINKNYENDTRRRGIETQLDLLLNKFINAYIAYTFTEAKFRGGLLNGKEMPAVPKHIFSAGTGIKINNFSLNIDCRDVSKSRFISDQKNSKGFVKGYFIAVIGCSLKYKEINIFGKINNIFDKKYSEYGVRSTMADTRNYYPSPGINFTGGIKFEF